MTAPMLTRSEYLRIESRIADHEKLKDWLSFCPADRILAWLSVELGMEVPPAFLAAYAVRRNVPRREQMSGEDLFPWRVSKNHRSLHPAKMLRAEANVRAGVRVGQTQLNQLTVWKRKLMANGQVVDYRPHSEEVWVYVDRRPGLDDDLIRRPDNA